VKIVDDVQNISDYNNAESGGTKTYPSFPSDALVVATVPSAQPNLTEMNLAGVDDIDLNGKEATLTVEQAKLNITDPLTGGSWKVVDDADNIEAYMASPVDKDGNALSGAGVLDGASSVKASGVLENPTAPADERLELTVAQFKDLIDSTATTDPTTLGGTGGYEIVDTAAHIKS
jgi:hypothetical protein